MENYLCLLEDYPPVQFLMIRTWLDFVLPSQEASCIRRLSIASLSGIERTKRFPEGTEPYLSSELLRDQTSLLAVLLDIFRGLQKILGFISGEN